MASSWYKEFQNKLNSASLRSVTKASETSKYSGVDALARLSSATDDSGSPIINKELNGVGEHLLDFGGRALDVISRPGYAVGGFLNDLLKDAVDPEHAGDENPFAASWEGLSGRRKEFFKPYDIIDPNTDDDSTGETVGRFLTNFLASVGTDPLTYIPGGAIAKGLKTGAEFTGVAQAGRKAIAPLNKQGKILKADQDLEDLMVDTNTQKESLSKIPVANEVPWAKGDVQANEASPLTGMDKPPATGDAFIDRLIGDPNLKTSIVGDLSNPAAMLNVEKAAKKLNFKSSSPSNDLATWHILRSQISDDLAEVRGLMHAGADLKNPWKDTLIEKAIAKPEPRTFDEIPAPVGKEIVTPGTPGIPLEESVKRTAHARAIRDSIKEYKTPAAAQKASSGGKEARSGSRFYFDGDEYDFSEWKKTFDLSEADDVNDLRINVDALDVNSPVAMTGLTPSQLASAIKTGEPKKFFEDISIAVGDDVVPLNEYITSRHAKYSEAAKGTPETRANLPANKSQVAAYEKATAAQKAEKEAYEAAIKAAETPNMVPARQKPTSEERRAWLGKYKESLPDSDLRKLDNLMRLGNEGGFNNAVDALMKREGKLDLETFEALEQAVKAGAIPKEKAKEIYARYGATTAKGAAERIAKIEEKIEKLREVNAKSILNAGDNAAVNVGEGSTEAMFKSYSPEIIGEPAKKIPLPKMPATQLRKFDLKRVGFAMSSRMKDEVLEAATNPAVMTMLDRTDRDIIFKSLKDILDSQWVKPKAEYKYKTNIQGTLRDKPTLGEGLGRNYGEYNRKSQYTFFSRVLKHTRDKMPKDMTPGQPRAEWLFDNVMPVLKAQDDLLRTYGIHPSLVESGKGLPLSLYDIMSSMPKSTAAKFLFNRKAEITPEQWMTLAEEAYRVGDDLDEVKSIASLHLDEAGADTFSFAGNADKQGKRAYENTLKRQEKQGKHGDNFNREAVYRGEGVRKRTFNDQLDEVITADFVTKIRTKVNYNSDRMGIQRGEFVQKASEDVIQKFVDDLASVKTQDEIFSLLENSRKGVRGFVKDNSDILPPPGAADEVKDGLELATTNPGTEVAAKQLTENGKTATKNERVTVGTKVMESVDDKMKEFYPTEDFSEILEFSMMGRIAHAMAPHLQEGKLRHMLLSGENVARFFSEQLSKRMSRFEGKYGSEAIRQAWHDIASGTPVNPANAELYDEFHKIISQIFDSKDTRSGMLLRERIEPNHINSNLKHFGLDPAKYGLEGKTFEEAYDSWKTWAADVDDPLNVLSRYHAAVQKSLSEKAMGERITMDFGSKTFKPGTVRIKAERNSRVAHLIDTRMFYPKEIADNLRVLDRTLHEMAQPRSSNKLLRLFDDLTHKYKAGLTIYRLGHHMRNMYGDVWLSYMDGIVSPRYYQLAWDTMMTRKGQYGELTGEAANLSTSAKTVATFKINGKEVPIGPDEMYRLTTEHGGMPIYATTEDLGVGEIANAGMQSPKRSITAPFGGKVHNLAAGASEFRDHYVRMAHMIGLAHKSKGIQIKRLPGESDAAMHKRALSEWAEESVARVRKFHPDGSDLSDFERKVAKRGILFYAWIRKAIPLVVESYALQPGRFLAFPKAMYALAEANGLDLNGFTDPFPTDQLFPSWMGGNQGPVAGNATEGYIGMRPGIPMMDILDQYFTSPGETFQTMVSATHPFVKIPYELATGTTTQGVPIKDLGKYALGQVPFGSQANTLLGKPVGGVSASDEGYSPEGIRDPKIMSTINTLTGLGLIDMSKPSYIKSGEFDLKYGRTEGP